MRNSIAIIGLGSGGQAMAADLIDRGHGVQALVNIDEAVIGALNEAGRISLSGRLGKKTVPVPPATSALEIVRDCDVLMVVTTADAHRELAESLVPYTNPDQLLVLHTGYVGGGAVVERAMRRISTDIPTITETNTLVYSALASSAGQVHIAGVKSWVELVAQDVATTATALEMLRPLFSQLVGGRSPLANGLNNPNPITHTPILLTHFAHAENEWRGGAPTVAAFFQLGSLMTDASSRLRDALESERMAVMRAIGLGDLIISNEEFTHRCYAPGAREESSPSLSPTLPSRFWAEDVPCGLVPIESLGLSAATGTPVTSAMITALGALVGSDLRRDGRTAEDVL